MQAASGSQRSLFNDTFDSRPSSARSSTWETGLRSTDDDAAATAAAAAAAAPSTAAAGAADDGKGSDGEAGTDKDGNSCGCGVLRKAVTAIWRTRDTEDTMQDKDTHIKTTLRELIIYCLFLIVLTVLTFGMTSATMYYYTKVMSELFLDAKIEPKSTTTYRTVHNIADWWKFVKSPLMDGLHWETWYNNMNGSSSKERNFIFFENKLLGVPRMRQLRVGNASCMVAPNFQSKISACYGPYSAAASSTAAFGLANSSAWTHRSEWQLDGRSHTGEIGSYDGGGFVADLTRDKDTSLAIIDELFTNLWIDRATRAVFVDFTVYNANINLFCVIRLIIEFPATGGALTTWEFRTVKLLRYVEPADYFIAVCEGLFMLFILYYIVEEVIEIKRHKLSYFKGFWNWLDIMVIAISLVCALFNIYRTVAVGQKLASLLQDENRYPDFDFLSYWQQHFNHAIAIAVFFAWVKIFKYISFNKTMTQLSSTLGACAKDLLGFCVMFFIVFFAFAQLGYLIFGTKVKDFREFQHAVFTLFRIILGDFNFDELESANKVLGPAFFILYVFFVFFVLINMFLAIINDTYSEVKADLSNQTNEFEMGEFFKKRAGKVLSKLHIRRDRIVDIQKAILSADINNDKQLDFNEWRTELKGRGYADGEIEALFAKFDRDGDRVLNEEEQRQMHLELEGQRDNLTEAIQRQKEQPNDPEAAAATAATASLNSDSDSDVDSDAGAAIGVEGGEGGFRPKKLKRHQFQHLSGRVDKLEGSVSSIVDKIDNVLCKLEQMELAKLRRRETMQKLMSLLQEGGDTARAEGLLRSDMSNWDH